jgi:hypothetical protein
MPSTEPRPLVTDYTPVRYQVSAQKVIGSRGSESSDYFTLSRDSPETAPLLWGGRPHPDGPQGTAPHCLVSRLLATLLAGRAKRPATYANGPLAESACFVSPVPTSRGRSSSPMDLRAEGTGADRGFCGACEGTRLSRFPALSGEHPPVDAYLSARRAGKG